MIKLGKRFKKYRKKYQPSIDLSFKTVFIEREFKNLKRR